MSTPVRPGGQALAKPMIIAIDGPAGAGKSSVTRTLAHRLGILYLDTGAMYRAATVGLVDAGIQIEDADAVANWVAQRHLDFTPEGEVLLDGQLVPKERLRSPATTALIFRVGVLIPGAMFLLGIAVWLNRRS